MIEIDKIDFPFKDDYQNKFESELINIYSGYKKEFEKNIPEKIKNNFDKVMKDEFFPLIEYIIDDGTVKINNGKEIEKHYSNISDFRYKHNLDIISKTLKWCKKNNLPIPNTKLYIWISDRFPWYLENLNKFPIYIYARPKNVFLPIFPDNTFECLQIDKKYTGECYDWDKIKNLIEQKCDGIKNKNKKNIIYFKGTPTTKRTYKLREYLERNQNKIGIPTKVLLDAWTVYEPIYKFCEYQFLLNLPGHYPWSNRLKYLFLMDSVVINVNVNTINLKPKYEDPPYITLIDYIVDNKDYVEILYKYYRVDSIYMKNRNIESNVIKLQHEEFDKFVKKLNEIYFKLIKSPKKYKNMAKKTTEKVRKLTNERIYQYIYKGILLNSQFIDKSIH